MIITTTRVQREISAIAFELASIEAKNCCSALRRLEMSDGTAQNLLATINWLKSELEKIPAHQSDIQPIEPTPSAAHAYRVALGTWMRVMSKRNTQDQAKGLQTNFHTLAKAAQGILDQVQDQLELGRVDINAFVEVKKDEEEEKSDKEFAEGTERSAHRGVPKKKK